MAACMRRKFLRNSGQFLRGYFGESGLSCKVQRCSCSSKSFDSNKGASKLFLSDEVQSILKRITGMDLSKVFRHTKEKLEAPTYRLVSDAKLKQLEEEAKKTAEKRLQMPPVIEERTEIDEVLAENPELEGLESSKFVFTDITYDLSDRERFIVVREPNGVLRKAKWEERDRILQIYFPRSQRQLVPPPLFEDERLQGMFDQDRHEYLLDAACVQFEPDAKDFIRIHQKTYDDIDAKEKHNLLRSTRHFGGLAFYLSRKQQIDGLLVDMIKRHLISDAVDVVHLTHLMAPDSPSAVEVKNNKLEGIDALKVFIEKDAKQTGLLELVLQSYENDVANQETDTEEQVSDSQR
ncbi:28S ribosomal protein S22, mitochondrial-like [Asterias rubens]|uniref:28S ribosomal protein S22, mitochondrial-like n=1 Tax=Asterias rubens TaxID=7604 RepID=UPI00145505C5|nr:28S ribosomal protein S22, mitochondrial-like [Asterias rubens]